VAHHWSAAQVRAYRLADNKLGSMSQWDSRALAIELAAIIEFDETPIEILGWDTAEIDVILADGELEDSGSSADPADEQIEPSPKPTSRSGDLWMLGKHRLLCGSSLEAECWSRLMGGETGAMLLSDPPFNVSISGHVCGLGKIQHREFAMATGEMTKAEFTAFLSTFLAAAKPHLKDGAIAECSWTTAISRN
jgi:hypothetical protein